MPKDYTKLKSKIRILEIKIICFYLIVTYLLPVRFSSQDFSQALPCKRKSFVVLRSCCLWSSPQVCSKLELFAVTSLLTRWSPGFWLDYLWIVNMFNTLKPVFPTLWGRQGVNLRKISHLEQYTICTFSHIQMYTHTQTHTHALTRTHMSYVHTHTHM